MEAVAQHVLSIAEYLQLEEENRQRYEYHYGEAIAMTGGSINHGLLICNLHLAVAQLLRDSDYYVLLDQIKLGIGDGSRYLYPDLMVVKGELQRSAYLKEAVTNPVAVFEVLSESTEGYDRGEKFGYYRCIQSLKHYVLLEQDKMQAEVYTRQQNAEVWQVEFYQQASSHLKLTALDCTLTLEELYRKIKWPKQQSADTPAN